MHNKEKHQIFRLEKLKPLNVSEADDTNTNSDRLPLTEPNQSPSPTPAPLQTHRTENFPNISILFFIDEWLISEPQSKHNTKHLF